MARSCEGGRNIRGDRSRPTGGTPVSPLEEPPGYDRPVAEGRIAPGSGRSLVEMLTALDADIPPDQGPSVTDERAHRREPLAGER